jgi:hypothetical protein
MGTRLRHPQVVLEVSRETPAPQVLVYGRYVAQKFTGNTWIPNPFVPVSVLEQHLDALGEAEALVKSRGMGLASARDDQLAIVFTDLELLRANVQAVCDRDVSHAPTIAVDCGMALKKFTRAEKPPLAASKVGTGKVKLVTRSVKRGATYEWELSADGGETWVSAGMTNGIADTTIEGLKEGVYYFRVRATVGRITHAWVGPISFRL